jgi:hypothetical protein
MRRSASLIVAVLLLTGLMVVGLATPASAACEGDPPTPSHPYGLLGLGMVGAPNWSEVPDTAPDPFADEDVRLVDVYGYGYQWGTYDLGCGADVARDPFAVMDTQIANLGWVVPTTAGVLVSSLQDLAVMGPFDFLDPLIGSMQASIRDRLWTTWFPIALIIGGLGVLFRARRAEYSATARTLGWVGLILAVSALFLQAPMAVDRAISTVMTKVVQTASAPFGTTSTDEQIAREVLYPQWLQGELGSMTGPTAEKFGPKLLAATHYTWSDEKLMATDPGATARINQAKATQFRQLAEQVKDQDPAAYSHVTGKQGESRLTAVMFAGLSTLGLALFVILGFIVLALAQLVARIFVIGFPLVGIVAVAHPRGQFTVMQLWSLFAAAFLAAVKFAVVTGVYTLLAGGVMQAPIGGVAKLGALLLLMILGLMFAKPFRSFKTLVPGLDPRHSYTMGALRRVTSHAGTEAAVTRGVESGIEATSHRPATQPKVPAEEESLPPLPNSYARARAGPGHATATAARHTGGAASVDEVGRPVWYAGDGVQVPSIFTGTPAKSTASDGPPSVVATPVVLPAAGSARNGHAPARSDVSARRPVAEGSTPALIGNGVVRSPVGASATSLAALGGPTVKGSAPTRTAEQAAEPVYARPASHVSESMTAPGELELADKQVDADGREVFVIYHRGDTYAGAH